MTRLRVLSSLAIAAFCLTGCETATQVQNSVTGFFGQGTQTSDIENQDIEPENDPSIAQTIMTQAPVYGCPSVQLMNELKQLHDYADFETIAANQKLSEIEIIDVDTDCNKDDNAISMKINITFEGETGPKARVKNADKANFSYPYFIAVADVQGQILAKEIFAASLSYGANQTQIKQIETINQLLPKTPETETYTILIGFQLTEEQLAYNRSKAPTLPAVTQ